MGANTVNRIYKAFDNFLGLDLRTSDLLREKGAATAMNNAVFRTTGALSKRNGYQFSVRGDLGSSDIIANGLFTWRDVNTTTGASTEKLIGVGQDLFEKKVDTFTVTALNSKTATYSVVVNSTTNVMEFIIKDLTTPATHTIALGTGLGGSDKTVTTLVSDINALTNFSASGASSSGNEKAAFVDVATDLDVSASGTTVNVQYWDKCTLPNGYTTPFSSHFAQKTSTDFENMSFVDVNNVLYISNGFDALHKFDGLRCYKAGVPQVASLAVADSSSGTTFSAGNKFDYRAEYEFKDAKGNLITGQLTSAVTQTQVGTKDIDVTVANLQSGTGYNVDQASVNGNQSTVTTITVTAGHKLQDGDFVYLLDRTGTSIVQREVTATTATTIVIDGAAVDVNSGDIISNIKISLYRTKEYSGSGIPGLFFLVKELVSDTGNATQVHTDGLTDALIGAQLIEPIKAHELPPVGKYMISWRGQLVITGKPDESDVVFYSDIESPEFFPTGNSFKVNNASTGIGTLDNVVYVYQSTAISAVTGELDNARDFSVTEASREGIGCSAHATIQEVKRQLWFLSDEGVFSIDPAKGLVKQGEQIDPKFDAGNVFNFKQAVAYNWVKNDKYLLFMPSLDQDTGNTISSNDTTSEILVYDYFRQAWLEWSNFNFMGGITVLDNKLMFVRRSTNTASSTPFSELTSILIGRTGTDYADHTEVTTFSYSTHWETLEEPSIWKKFLRIKMHSLDTSLNTFEVDSFILTVKAQHNYILNNIATISMDFSGGAAGWGLGGWGEFPWGEARLLSAKNKMASKKVKSHKLEFSNSTLHENILISGYELEIVTPYSPFLKE